VTTEKRVSPFCSIQENKRQTVSTQLQNPYTRNFSEQNDLKGLSDDNRQNVNNVPDIATGTAMTASVNKAEQTPKLVSTWRREDLNFSRCYGIRIIYLLDVKR
jgi:hypothetical protein